MSAPRIAVSQGSGHPKYENYAHWLRRNAGDSPLEVADLAGMTPAAAVEELSRCAGLVLCGGPDLEAARYARPGEAHLYRDADPPRDRREEALLDAALESGIPILGICRGLQLLNARLGGTLVADIPTRIPRCLAHRADPDDTEHPVAAAAGSLLARVCGATEGVINSYHHQSIDAVASHLVASAWAPDGVIEAVEMPGSPVLAVQWHPERMPEGSTFSDALARWLLARAGVLSPRMAVAATA